MTAVLGVVQARMGSTRLPGKVLHPLGGRSVLGWVVRAARESGACDELVVATSTLAEDRRSLAASRSIAEAAGTAMKATKTRGKRRIMRLYMNDGSARLSHG